MSIGSQLIEVTAGLTNAIEGQLSPAIVDMNTTVDRLDAEVSSWITQIQDAIQAFSASVDTHCVDARTAIDHEAGEVLKVLGAIDQEATAIATQAGQFSAESAAALELLRAGREAAAAQGSMVEQKATELLTEVNSMVDGFEGTVNSAVEAFEAGGDSIVEATATLATDARTQFDTIRDGMDALDDFVSSAFEAEISASTQRVEDMLGSHEQLLLQGAESVAGEVHEVLDTVEQFMNAAHELEEAFDGDLGQIIEKVDQVTELLKQIRPVIDVIKQVA